MNITIDGKVYDLDTLSEDAKAQIGSIQAVDLKLNELKRDTAFVMTARNAYVQALKKSLGDVIDGEPLKEKAKIKKSNIKSES
jgi:hypothetical protein